MENYYASVAPIIEEIGVKLKSGFGNAEAIAFKNSNHGSAVTQFDKDAEQFIAERLNKIYPDIPFFGEEFGGNNTAQRFWLVDPIDGTSNYIRGLPFSTTMITLIQEGQPVFSVIYNFVTKEMYSATKGAGAIMNGAPIHISERPINYSNIFLETNKDKKENVDAYARIYQKFSIYATKNSGFEYCAVASGKIEGRVAFGDPPGMDWDYAPGALLVSEAGGVVRNIGSSSYDYKNHNFVAGSEEVCDELERCIRG